MSILCLYQSDFDGSANLQVTGVEALRSFSKHFTKPYESICSRDQVERLENRVSALQYRLKEAEEELERVKTGKNKD